MNYCKASERRGQVALCRQLKTGVVTHEAEFFDSARGVYRTRYFGVNLDGGEWESVDPTWLAANIAAWVNRIYPD